MSTKGKPINVGPARQIILEAATTYAARRAVYGESEQRYAAIMSACFPDGLTIASHEEWVRFGLFTQIIGKVARYTNDFKDPHVDSVHDLGVYAFMLEAEDRKQA